MTQLFAYQAALGLSLLERFKFYERLQPAEESIARGLFDALIADEETQGELGPAMAELLPPRWWLPHLEFGAPCFLGAVAAKTALGARWDAFLVEAMHEDDDLSDVLDQLRDRRTKLDALAWTRIDELASGQQPGIALRASRVSVAAGRMSPPVAAILEKILGNVADELDEATDDSFDFGLDVPELLGQIARIGTAARSLAPVIERFVRVRWPQFLPPAAHALAALGDPSVIPSLEFAEDRQPEDVDEAIETVRPALRLARWRLSGDTDALFDAARDAGEYQGTRMALMAPLEVAEPSERQLRDLLQLAQYGPWYVPVARVIAAHAARCPAVVADLPRPKNTSGQDSQTSFFVARWRARLTTDSAFADALEPTLDEAYDAWIPYVALDLGTPEWRATIERGLRGTGVKPIFEGLLAAPRVGVKFARVLLEIDDAEAVVTSLWRHDREAFWRALA